MSSFAEIFLLTLAGLIPIVNPLSTAPLFVALTERLSLVDQAKVAIMAPIFAFFILVFFLIAGDSLIDFFGISIAGIRIAGGIVIGIIGLQMLFPQFNARYVVDQRNGSNNVSLALSPLAIPSISGPGSIAVVLSIGASVPNQNWLTGYSAVLLAIAIAMAIVFATFVSASLVARFVGQSLIDGITRIMGFLLIAIGVQFVAIGVVKFQTSPPQAAIQGSSEQVTTQSRNLPSGGYVTIALINSRRPERGGMRFT
jgi:multiple antibiotic resistance protein